jgi:hypothetical protein
MLLRKLLCILPCLFLAGCVGPFELSWRTIVVEPLQFCPSKDRRVMHSYHSGLASEAWKEIAAGQSESPYSKDYECGFKEGFADYLDAGGTGEPPPFPPRRYWRSSYRTPEGHKAITDWFAGFRHGAGCAKESGLRHYAVIPSSFGSHAAAQVPGQEPIEAPGEMIATPPPVAGPSPDGSQPPNGSKPPKPAPPQPLPKPNRDEAPMPPVVQERS